MMSTLRQKRVFSSLSRFRLPANKGEPFLDYAPGSNERAKLKNALAKLRKAKTVEIPAVVGGKEIFSGKTEKHVMPTDHGVVLANVHMATEETVKAGVDAALKAKCAWENMPFGDRAMIFRKAADLVATKYRADLCAAVMLGTGKNVWQAEIDAAVEAADFLRMNTKWAEEIYDQQPQLHSTGVWNRLEYRPLEGFVLAVSPFNFLAIGANLPSAPALMGNTVLWKPSTTAALGNWVMFQIFREAGVPDGVINFMPGEGPVVGGTSMSSPHFAGLHFTGSTNTFNNLWRTIGNNLGKYRSYPRIVGETGGKNFHFIHKSAALDHAVFNTARAAFEYQGQKCSACSRAYVPKSLWPQFKTKLLEVMSQLKMGQPDEFDSFLTAVIDKKSFDNIAGYITNAKKSDACEIIAGGEFDKSRGYFIQPTVIVTTDPMYVTMKDELFGPVLTLYVYPDEQFEETLELCDKTTNYALTGAIFAQDRKAVLVAQNKLRHSAGNFYINDKSTGAIVGEQPFGGGRGSGTNDKAGSPLNLYRWVSPRTIKENTLPTTTWKYPHMNLDS